MRLLIATLLSLSIAIPAMANNVVPTQMELSETNIAWLNKHRTDENFGVHRNFAWYRTETGQIWSVSINEYRKAGNVTLSEFMNEYINLKVQEEAQELQVELTKALRLMDALTTSEMTFEAAIIVTQSIFERFSLKDGNPTVTSNKVKGLEVSL